MKRLIIFSLLISIALGLSARTFLANDQIRVNVDQTTCHDDSTDPSEAEHKFHWDYGMAVLWLYLYGPSGNEWLKLNYLDASTFVATMPAGKNYDHLILVRKNPAYPDAGFDDNPDVVWNRTCNLEIPDHAGCNVLYKFWKGGGGCDGAADWHVYTPSINDIKATVSSVMQEEMEICPSAAGTLISLHPNIRSDKKDYDYDKVVRHTWLYSTDKSNWTSLDGFADNSNKANGKERNEEFDRDFYTNLPTSIPSGGIYYYLYSFNPEGRRLIHIKTNPKGCDLDCEITAFETANSAVNADNNTFTLDGMVAFGEANGKALKIECGGVDTTIASPKSPQSFSLHGVPAATTDGQKATAKASFVGGGEACAWEIQIDVPNATIAADTTRMDSLTGKTFVLTPVDTIASNAFVWLKKNEVTGEVVELTGLTSKELVVDPYDVDTTVTYIYKEYNPAPGTMANLMTNGSYEDTWDYTAKKVSEYDYWGTFPQTASTSIDFYTNEAVNPGLAKKDNGFAIVRDAKNFAHTYAAVKARDGVNFALFDAKSGSEGANKKAWLATTTMHPDLKLKKGTTYVLSFWAANINNYGEMDNAAEFEFQIRTKAGALIAKSKKTLKLSDAKFRNNIWHQLSETFTAKEDYDDIVISVVNLNDKELKVGNDFALDDIQFHPISSVSRNVKSQQIFVVTAHEPKVDAFTATTQNMLCSADQFTINMAVTYRNAQGKLCIRDVERDSIYLFDVPQKNIEEQGSYSFSIVLPDSLAAARQWEAYFQIAPANKQTAQSAAPVRYSCIKTDTTLCEGGSLTWKGTTYPQTPYIGTDTFTSGYDSLILTIVAIPRVTVGTIAMTCDQANEIRIPFSVAHGTPDTYDIAVNGSHYAGAVDGSDIVFSLTTMEAGDYAATMTVSAAGTECESTQDISFTIALSGQMYSKWTDVLFISNKEGRFTGYQWFADGVLMSGETMQRLYDANGLSGTAVLYHCRLTTTDGKTLYTCPLTFDEVTPSRTVTSTPSQVQSTKIYDAMGRVINGTPHNGIYIIMETMEDGTVRARKINAYE